MVLYINIARRSYPGNPFLISKVRSFDNVFSLHLMVQMGEGYSYREHIPSKKAGHNLPASSKRHLNDTVLGLSRVYSDRQLNSDSDLVCFIFQIWERK